MYKSGILLCRHHRHIVRASRQVPLTRELGPPSAEFWIRRCDPIVFLQPAVTAALATKEWLLTGIYHCKRQIRINVTHKVGSIVLKGPNISLLPRGGEEEMWPNPARRADSKASVLKSGQ